MRSSKPLTSTRVTQAEALTGCNDSSVLTRTTLAPIDSSGDEFSCSHPSSSLFLPHTKVGNSMPPAASGANDKSMVMTSAHHQKHQPNDPSTSANSSSPFTSSAQTHQQQQQQHLHQSHPIKSSDTTDPTSQMETSKPHGNSSVHHVTGNIMHSTKSSCQNEVDSTSAQVSMKLVKGVSCEKNLHFQIESQVDSMTELKLISPSTEVHSNTPIQSTC